MRIRMAAAAAAGLVVALLATACGSTKEPTLVSTPGVPDKISVVLSWSPQPAQGGLFAAKVKGFFAENGLDVTLVPSGPRVPRKPLLAAGEVQFGMLSADEILLAREEGLNLVALHSTMQENPLGFVYHKSNPVSSIADLSGRTVFVAPGQAWWKYLVGKYHLNVTEQAYQGLAPFLADTKSITQGFVTSEPFYATNEGADVGFLSLDKSGWSTYMNLIATTDEFKQRNPDVVKRFVKASLQGWEYYMEHADEINSEILKENPQATAEAQKYDSDRLIPMLKAGDTASKGFGFMSPARWAVLAEQLKANGILPDSADVEAAFDTSFWEAVSGS